MENYEIDQAAENVVDFILEISKKPVNELTSLDCHILLLASFLIKKVKERNIHENS